MMSTTVSPPNFARSYTHMTASSCRLHTSFTRDSNSTRSSTCERPSPAQSMWHTMRLRRKPSLTLSVTKMLEHLEHPARIEAAVPKVRFDVCPQLELTALLGGPGVDACSRQALQMVVALIRIYDMNRLVATLEPILDERKQHAIFLILAVEERAHMTYLAELRSRKGNGCRPHWCTPVMWIAGVLGSAPERDGAWGPLERADVGERCLFSRCRILA